jgi:hypothetical protein
MSKARIAVCTPLYGDAEAAGLSRAYTGALYCLGSDLAVLCGEQGWDSGDIELDPSPYPNSIEHARNNLVRLFLEHPREYTHALLWDSDEKGTPNQIAKLIMRMLRADYPVMSVPCPEKQYFWEKAARAAHHFVVKGALSEKYEDKNYTDSDLAEIIRGAACRYVPDPERGQCELGEVGIDGFAPMLRGHVSLGFAMVRRDVFQKMSDYYRETLAYDFEDHEGKPIECVGLFHTTLKQRKLSAEDSAFCDRWRAMGGSLHLYLGEGAPLEHIGRTTFKGTREAMLKDWGLK